MNNSAVSVFPMNEEYFLMPIENWPFGSLATFPVEDGMLANIHPFAFNDKDIVPRRPFQVRRSYWISKENIFRKRIRLHL